MAIHKYTTPEKWLDRPVSIVMIGAGGTGSHLIDSLARIDYAIKRLGGHGLDITLFDDDTVSEFSAVRQRFYPADIGELKAPLLIHRLNLLYGLSWKSVPRKFHADSLTYSNCPDIIITCVDKPKIRAEIARAGENMPDDRLYLDMGNADFSGQVILGHLNQQKNARLKRLPNVFSFYPELESMLDDDDKPSCSMEESLKTQTLGINQAIANAASTLIWLLLREGGLNHQGVYLNIKTGESSPIRIL
jgi:PRTRC genetic system ThiF family protein